MFATRGLFCLGKYLRFLWRCVILTGTGRNAGGSEQGSYGRRSAGIWGVKVNKSDTKFYSPSFQSSGDTDTLLSRTGCSMTTTKGRKATQFESILVSFLCNESIRKIFKYFYFCRDWTIQWTWKTIIHTKYPAHWSVWRCDETLQNWGVIHNF